MPTLKIFSKGVVLGTFEGLHNKTELKRVFDRYLPRPSDEMLTEAMSHYEQGNIEQSLAVLSDALENDPLNIRILKTCQITA